MKNLITLFINFLQEVLGLKNESLSIKTKLVAVAVIVACIVALSILSGCVPFGASTTGTHDAWVGNPTPSSRVDVYRNQPITIGDRVLTPEQYSKEFEK